MIKEKVAILIPVRFSIPVEFWIKFMGLLGYMGKVCQPQLFTSTDTPLYEARNRLVEDALRSDSEYTLWIDSDVIPPLNVYEQLRSHNKDIVSGLYFGITPPFNPIAHLWYGDHSEFIRSADLKIGETFPVYSVGMGCILVKTEVFKRMESPWFDHRPGEISEDVFFCRKANNLGYQIYLNTNIMCEHFGATSTIASYVSYQAYQRRMEELQKNGNKR